MFTALHNMSEQGVQIRRMWIQLKDLIWTGRLHLKSAQVLTLDFLQELTHVSSSWHIVILEVLAEEALLRVDCNGATSSLIVMLPVEFRDGVTEER